MRYIAMLLLVVMLTPAVIAPSEPLRYVSSFTVTDGIVTLGDTGSLREQDGNPLIVIEEQTGFSCPTWTSDTEIYEGTFPGGSIRTVGFQLFCISSSSLTTVAGIANETFPYLGQYRWTAFNCDISFWWQCLDELPEPGSPDGSSTFLQSVITTGPFTSYVQVGGVNLTSAFTVDGSPAIPDTSLITEKFFIATFRVSSPGGTGVWPVGTGIVFQFGYDTINPASSNFCAGASFTMPPDNVWTEIRVEDNGLCNGANDQMGNYYATFYWTCGAGCVPGPPFAWVDLTRVVWGVSLSSSDEYSLNAAFTIGTSPRDSGLTLEWFCDPADIQYDIGIRNGTGIDWLGDICAIGGAHTYTGYIASNVIVISDNSTATDGGGLAIDYLRMRYYQSVYFIGGDSLAWLIYLALVAGGAIIASVAFAKWREDH